jgi:hypothetical protein
MKRAEAKIVENRKEDPASEPDQAPNTWLIEAKLDEDILDWENVRLDLRFSEIDAQDRFTPVSHADSTRAGCWQRIRAQSPETANESTKGSLWHTDQEFIFRHYRELVKPEAAAKYWEIRPAVPTNLVTISA